MAEEFTVAQMKGSERGEKQKWSNFINQQFFFAMSALSEMILIQINLKNLMVYFKKLLVIHVYIGFSPLLMHTLY